MVGDADAARDRTIEQVAQMRRGRAPAELDFQHLVEIAVEQIAMEIDADQVAAHDAIQVLDAVCAAQDSKYRMPANALPALADLPMEGHGTLIAKRWVLTAAHVVQMMLAMPEHRYVIIAGKQRKVTRIIVYPDFPKSWTQWNHLLENMKTEDPDSWMSGFASYRAAMHDIALLELAQPVEDVEPVKLYLRPDEPGHVAKIFGKGATGNSSTGAAPDAPHRTELRRAYNRIVAAKNQWLYYTFDCGSAALPLEGMIASGDSGGPVLINEHSTWKLAGLAQGLSGTKSDLLAMRAGTFRMGECGQEVSSTRVSFYVRWIEDTITSR